MGRMRYMGATLDETIRLTAGVAAIHRNGQTTRGCREFRLICRWVRLICTALSAMHKSSPNERSLLFSV